LWRMSAAGVAMVFLLGGCGAGTTEEERAYIEAMEAERQIRESIRVTLDGDKEEDAAIKMVREQESPDGVGNTGAWVQRLTDGSKGDVLFPRWQARRKGVGRHEVWFSYTVLDVDGTVEKRGLAWVVDLSLKLVDGPRDLTAKELGADSSSLQRLSAPTNPPAVELIQD